MENVTEIQRNVNEWVTPEKLRALIKANLKLNARQVTVKCAHSLQYVTLTIRDAGVDIAKVEAFAKSFATWSMDNSDYVTGQSVEVVLASEVREALAQSMRHIVDAMEIPAPGKGLEVAPGIILWNVDRNVWLSRKDGKRSTNQWTDDIVSREEWALNHIALNLALLSR